MLLEAGRAAAEASGRNGGHVGNGPANRFSAAAPAMAYSGHGVQMSVHMGQVLAEMMQGRPAVHPFAAEWNATPGHFGRAWFLPLLGYYQALDRIH